MLRKLAWCFSCYILLLNGAYTADLIEVYRQALSCDATFQEAISQSLATKQGVPITMGALLPAVNLSLNTAVTRTAFAGASFLTDPITGIALSPRNNTARSAKVVLTASQTVFNFAQVSAVASQISLSLEADAVLNAALQDLMVRVVQAYFAVLEDEDILEYNEEIRLAYEKQLKQVREQHRVGTKSVTDVYTAEAAYESSVSSYITAENNLYDAKDNLRVITGVYYDYLVPLQRDNPLIEPCPRDINVWSEVSFHQNWNIIAARYNVSSKKYEIHRQFAGHLPTVAVEGLLDRIYTNNINGYNTINNRNGPSAQVDKQIGVTMNVPLLAGGTVVAQTSQAFFYYEAARDNLEFTIRRYINIARQSYRGIVYGIDAIKADRRAIFANEKSIEGMRVGYKVGTTSLVDVINQQQRLFNAQLRYASNRYGYINDIFLLKFAAGTLNFEDLCAVNSWLRENPPLPPKKEITIVKNDMPKSNSQLAITKKPKKTKLILAFSKPLRVEKRGQAS